MNKELNALHVAGMTANDEKFCVMADNGRLYWINNFSKKALKNLLRNKAITFPIKIQESLVENTADIIDTRVS